MLGKLKDELMKEIHRIDYILPTKADVKVLDEVESIIFSYIRGNT